MKRDTHYIHGKQVVHAKSGKTTPLQSGKVPVVVHKGELVVTGKDVKLIKRILKSQ